MRQFDVFPNPSARSRAFAPFVVALQSHHLRWSPTVVVAPLIHDTGRERYSEISVAIEFNGSPLVLYVAELAAIDARHLQRSVGNLAEHEDAIRRALDRIFTGF